MHERLHLDFTYSYLNWKIKSTLNRADFYDLFGPTKTSRKGYSVGLEYQDNLIYDKPLQMDYTIYTTYFGNLERLPLYQNVAVSYNKFLNAGITWDYQYLVSSLGAVDKEKGFNWGITFDNNYVRTTLYPQLHTDLDYGFALPINHSSIWFRSSAGYSDGQRLEPFANFYFGGFGNNYIDYREEKRYREYYSFPGVELNSIGGTNYGKLMFEWNLPPLRFSNIGFTSFFLNYARTSLFSTAIVTNVDSKEFRRSVLDFGTQIDFTTILLFHLKMTFSAGYAAALERNLRPTDEWMFSLKIL